MRSILIAATAFLAGIWLSAKKKSEPLPLPAPAEAPYNPAGTHITYKWSCWLCTGESQFACARPGGTVSYMLPCNWCGMDNRVEVRPPSASPKQAES